MTDRPGGLSPPAARQSSARGSCHFRLFAWFQRPRRGSGRTEASMLTRTWPTAGRARSPAPGPQPQIELSVSTIRARRAARHHVRPALADQADLLIDKPDRRTGGYYTGFALRITAPREAELVRSLTTWTAQLTHDAKEGARILHRHRTPRALAGQQATHHATRR